MLAYFFSNFPMMIVNRLCECQQVCLTISSKNEKIKFEKNNVTSRPALQPEDEDRVGVCCQLDASRVLASALSHLFEFCYNFSNAGSCWRDRHIQSPHH
ncbi:hypothetical protein ANANG_G00199220, partial [Anguilla anguilla]